MAIPVVQEPTYLFERPFADTGTKNIIPASNNEATGLASLLNGFPAITQVPVKAGGIPPTRADFNGILYMLSAFAYWYQSGGLMTYKETLQYNINCCVVYNKKIYVCLLGNGVDTAAGIKIPAATGSDLYWQEILPFIGGITPNEVQDKIDISIGEIPKPVATHFGSYSSISSSGTATTDGIITAKSRSNTAINGYVNGLEVMYTAGRSKYGQGSCSISFPVPKGATYLVSGAEYVRWLPLISD